MSNVPNDDRLVVGASVEAAPPQHHAVDGVLLPLEDLPTLSSELLPHSHISITTDCEHCVGEMGMKTQHCHIETKWLPILYSSVGSQASCDPRLYASAGSGQGKCFPFPLSALMLERGSQLHG